MTEVSLKNVSKRYGTLQALANMDWTANPGEFIVLFGPSGAGKTTTLKIIAGLEMPEDGDVRFDGQSVREVETADRDVAMAFENYALYPHLSVFDNIAFPLLVPGRTRISADELKRHVVQIAELLQIDMLLERRPNQLSGGQRQRVALGRCLVREPRVCLLDEPIAHLDAKLRHRMYAELKRIQRERGTTTIYATPAQSEAMAMGDRIVVVRGGVVQQIGTPRDLYERPANVHVANFGGEQVMNIIPAEITAEGGVTWFLLAGNRVPVPAALRTALEDCGAGHKVLVGCRPVDIKCTSCEDGMTLPATLYSVEPLGRATLVTALVGEQLIEVCVDVPPDVEIGAAIWLSVDGSRLYVFDSVTETRLVSPLGAGEATAGAGIASWDGGVS